MENGDQHVGERPRTRDNIIEFAFEEVGNSL